MSYDPKLLLDKLQDQGLDLAEEAAGIVVEAVFDWAVESAMKSENKVDDMLGVMLPAIKPWVMEQIDKIDGEEG